MTTRNFKQCGQAYGLTPASITATIDGTVVYSGSISTLDAPLPARPEGNASVPIIFTWTGTVAFEGTQSYSIAVSGSPLLLGFTGADHVVGNNVAEFGTIYTYESGGVVITDPFSNVAIDGVVQTRSNDNTLTGQWEWLIPVGSTFTATLNVNAGVEPTGNIPTPP